ncbi:MAG TPA: AAA family ATPase [Syntrophomonadaceae bacterium]|nr:AAA family ATPase [Syntrophomonadaceae bacterium]
MQEKGGTLLPFLKDIRFHWESVNTKNRFPYNIPALQGLGNIELTGNVTFFVGENGSGKSTLLEGLAIKCGFQLMGGGRASLVDAHEDHHSLEELITLSWLPKVKTGFFLRAETFYNYASYIDELAKESPEAYQPYGGQSLHKQSHGEAFLSLFLNRFHMQGIYLLDEPEAALSPQRQLAFLRLIWKLEQSGQAQFIIATHSPILMAYPGATILDFDQSPMQETVYENTEHYFITKRFLNDRKKFLEELFAPDNSIR